METTESSILDHWSQRALERSRISTFFAKLLSESMTLGADQLSLCKVGVQIDCEIIRAGIAERTISVKGSWWQPIESWLSEIGESPLSNQAGGFVQRIGADLVSAHLSRECLLDKRDRIKLTAISKASIGDRLIPLHMTAELQKILDSALQARAGLIVVVAPTADALKLALATYLQVTGWAALVSQPSLAELPEVLRLSSTQPTIVGLIANDIADALLQFRALKEPQLLVNIVAIISQGFVRQVCSNCAKKTQLSTDLVALLPDYLRALSREKYLVGRGCQACGEAGYRGWLGFQSVLIPHHDLLSKLQSDCHERAVVSAILAAGALPLLEQGLRLALSGQTTMESVLSVTKLISDTYLSEIDNPVEVLGESRSDPLFPTPLKAKKDRFSVMIVEDDRDQREILEIALRTESYEVFSASNGPDALEMLSKGALPDLIVSDLMMPVMEGSEFVARLKADATLHRIPVLMFTVVEDDEKEYALLNLGADDYCEKTVKRKVLFKRIERLLERSA